MTRPQWWWIGNPRGHREYEMENMPSEMEFAGETMPVISSGDPGDEWVCDYCNATIPLVNQRQQAVPVPMEGGHALCPECMVASLRRRGLPQDPSEWSAYFCGCPPCAGLIHTLRALGLFGRN